MDLVEDFKKFAPKSVVKRVIELKSLLSNAYRLPFNLRIAFARSDIERIMFHSGLGDSANVLYGLVRSMKPDVCVEIGSARGKSACYIGIALKENGRGKLYAIDPHLPTDWNDEFSVNTIEIFKRNISRLNLSNQIKLIRSHSDAAASNWSRSIDLLLIDGDHSYTGVMRDWNFFVPHMSQFGIVLFHDTIWDLDSASKRRQDMGVPRFVDELRQQGYPVITINRDCGLTLVQPRIGGIPLRESPAKEDVGGLGVEQQARRQHETSA